MDYSASTGGSFVHILFTEKVGSVAMTEAQEVCLNELDPIDLV